jgi:DNA-3-methyladenine glycosylase II
MAFTAAHLRAARRHLRKHDPIMRAMINQVGPCTVRCQRDRFQMLVRSIISQQISVGAARSIRNRLEQLVAPERITSESLLKFKAAKLRSAGISPQKAAYLLDLANKVEQGTLVLRTIGRRSDEDVIKELTQVKGIGHWTAQMFLMFALGRLDIFPADDLGIRIAIRDHYDLKELPGKKLSHEIAQPWRPYATIASWYLWRSLDLQRQRKAGKTGSST